MAVCQVCCGGGKDGPVEAVAAWVGFAGGTAWFFGGGGGILATLFLRSRVECGGLLGDGVWGGGESRDLGVGDGLVGS